MFYHCEILIKLLKQGEIIIQSSRNDVILFINICVFHKFMYLQIKNNI